MRQDHFPMRGPLVALVFVLLVSAQPGTAADGDLDPAFGTGGLVVTTLADHGEAADVAIQDDGKIVVVGTLHSNDTSMLPALVVARYLPSGVLDTDFAGVGYVTAQVEIFGGSGRALVIQPDGGILALGQSVPVTHGSSIMFLVRYDADGTPDSTFGVGGMVELSSLVVAGGDVALTGGGEILVAYAGTDAAFSPFTRVQRLQTNGMVDASFGTGGTADVPLASFGVAPALAIRSDGKIVVAGGQIVQISPGFVTAFGAARLLPGGAVDTSFGIGGASPPFGATEYVGGAATAVALQGDDRLVLSGATGGTFALVGMGADGGLDAGFGTGGVSTDPFAPSANAIVAVDGDRFVAAGGGAAQFALARVGAGGALDPTFASGGKVLTSFGDPFSTAEAIAVQDDGAIVAVGTTGSASASSIALARYLSPAACADTDGDGLCDDADECPDGATFTSARLAASDLGAASCEDRLAFTGTVAVPPVPAIDLVATGLRVVVRDAVGQTVIDETLPAGPYDDQSGAGWRRRDVGSHATWKFIRRGLTAPISRAVVRQRPGTVGVLKISVKGRAACFAAPLANLPLRATVVVTPPEALTGQCGEARFGGPPEGTCHSGASGRKVVCR